MNFYNEQNKITLKMENKYGCPVVSIHNLISLLSEF